MRLPKIKIMNEVNIAKKFINKAKNAESRGIVFELSFQSFKNLMRAKKCFYTRTLLTNQTSEDGVQKPTDRTIERVDSSKGYVKGNCVACCHEANRWKAYFENPVNTIITPKTALKMLRTFDKKAKIPLTAAKSGV